MNTYIYYGGIVISFALLTYALEHGRRFTVPLALACALASGYGFAKGSWSFGVIEALWCVIALRRAAKYR
jgi:hypothetical protein